MNNGSQQILTNRFVLPLYPVFPRNCHTLSELCCFAFIIFGYTVLSVVVHEDKVFVSRFILTLILLFFLSLVLSAKQRCAMPVSTIV